MCSPFIRTCETFFLFAVLMCFLIPGSGFSAGFALIEQSVSGLGNAYSGGAAGAEDATTIYYNPAGLSRLSQSEVIAGAHFIIPYAQFQNEGSTHVLQPLTGVPLRGGNSGDAVDDEVIPNFYASYRISDRLSIGLGVNSPFGLATQYGDTWVGRYHAIDTDVLTININPAIAYRVSKYLSLGAGFNAQYLNAELSNAIDFGTIGLLSGVPGLLPQSNDGKVTLEGDSWAYGWNAGALIEFREDSRIGLAYRSRMRHKVEGDADFLVPVAAFPLTATGSFTDCDAEAEIVLPDSASLSLYHRFDKQWAAMADVTWTNWSVFEELRFKFSNGQADGVTTEKWKDSWRYSAGISFYPTEQLTLRTGVAYDKTPVPDEQHRTPRIPDEDRTWVAFGIGYKVSSIVGFDIGYAHLFLNDPKIEKSPTGEDAIRGGLKGTYDAHIDIVSAQINLTF